MSNMTAGMSPETAFQMAINKRAWPNYDEIDMAISRSICWKMDLYDMKAHSFIPHLLRPFDESHLSRAEGF